MSNTTVSARLDRVIEAIAARQWLHGTYESELSKEEGSGPVSRDILPFKVYRSRDGALVMDAYDTYRKDVRTFRLDRFTKLSKGKALEGDDPAVLQTRGGEVAVYPSTWKLVQARPQTIRTSALDKFLAAGWNVVPPAMLIEPPALAH